MLMYSLKREKEV